jgi:hypothetical protein
MRNAGMLKAFLIQPVSQSVSMHDYYINSNGSIRLIIDATTDFKMMGFFKKKNRKK